MIIWAPGRSGVWFWFGGYLSVHRKISTTFHFSVSWMCYKSHTPRQRYTVVWRENDFGLTSTFLTMNTSRGSEIYRLSRHERQAWYNDMKYIDSCSLQWSLMSMKCHSFSTSLTLIRKVIVMLCRRFFKLGNFVLPTSFKLWGWKFGRIQLVDWSICARLHFGKCCI